MLAWSKANWISLGIFGLVFWALSETIFVYLVSLLVFPVGAVDAHMFISLWFREDIVLLSALCRLI